MSSTEKKKLFISHSTVDDDFVRRLRETLAPHGQDSWVDSRELRGGDALLAEIKRAISESSAYAVVVSPDSLQSEWVGHELKYALQIQQERGKDAQGKDIFPVIPLSLNGTKLGLLKTLFTYEPVFISVSSEAGEVERAVDDILVALGKRLKAEVEEKPQPVAEPLEELVLELSNLKFTDLDVDAEVKGTARASADAQLIYEPATQGQRSIVSKQKWRFIAPIGPIEASELKWYLEQYAIWPSEYFAPRAREVEKNLKKWGELLYKAVMPPELVSDVLTAWGRIEQKANRRFSVYIDTPR